MNPGVVVSVVGIIMALTLVVAALRNHRLGSAKAMRLALIWAAIIAGLALLLSRLGA